MITRIALVCTLIATLVLGASPAAAITDGELDGNGHPYVGLMSAHDADGVPLWRCSGTLISATLFLTAGHCTEAPAARVQVFFAAGPIPIGTWAGPEMACGAATGYPCVGDASGTPYTHPDYDPNRFFIRDLGLVVLDSPMVMSQYGILPTVNQLDSLKPRRGTTFTAVGYGLQKSLPAPIPGPEDTAFRTRMVAHPHLIQINVPGFVGDFSMLLSNNANTGGTCFGDSGGPNFLGNSRVIAGVTSFGLNGTCAGTGGVYRLDRSWNLDWLATFSAP